MKRLGWIRNVFLNGTCVHPCVYIKCHQDPTVKCFQVFRSLKNDYTWWLHSSCLSWADSCKQCPINIDQILKGYEFITIWMLKKKKKRTGTYINFYFRIYNNFRCTPVTLSTHPGTYLNWLWTNEHIAQHRHIKVMLYNWSRI